MPDPADSTTPPASPSSQLPPDAPELLPELPPAQLVMAMALAFLVPGLGHLYLRRLTRGVIFIVLVALAIGIGCNLQGNLYVPVQHQPLTYLATWASMGMGIPYFALRYGMHYEGEPSAAGFDYGTTFLLTAGLMNLLLVLDVWDIGTGKKE